MGTETGRLTAVLLMTACCGCAAGSAGGYNLNGGQVDGPLGPFDQASHASLMQEQKGSGSVLTHPHWQIITFNNDPLAADTTAFAQALAKSATWSAMTSEYGVGDLTVAPPLAEMHTWTTSVTDGDLSAGQPSDIEAYLVENLDGPSPAWGPPNSSTIYMLFMPAGLNVSPNNGAINNACDANILAWHTAMTLPQSKAIVSYAVIVDCGQLGTLSPINSRTFSTSHEIIEAVTNPTMNAYFTQDTDHLVWTLASGGELGAVCEAQKAGDPNLAIMPPDIPFVVQRSWSNAAAHDGHVPCVPALTKEVFFDAVPRLSQTVMMSFGASPAVAPIPTMGLQVAAGSQASVDVDLFSDGPTDPWSVTAEELATHDLQLNLDKNTGKNGTILHLQVSMANNPNSPQQVVRLVSTLHGAVNNQYFLVHN